MVYINDQGLHAIFPCGHSKSRGNTIIKECCRECHNKIQRKSKAKARLNANNKQTSNKH